MIVLKRAYEPAKSSDGRRVLVDRLWPRGRSKQLLKLDAWDKGLAPSTELRKWFGHDPKRWTEFKKKYRAELRGKKDELRALKKSARKISLIYGAKDEEHNEAVVLKEVLDGMS